MLSHEISREKHFAMGINSRNSRHVVQYAAKKALSLFRLIIHDNFIFVLRQCWQLMAVLSFAVFDFFFFFSVAIKIRQVRSTVN